MKEILVLTNFITVFTFFRLHVAEAPFGETLVKPATRKPQGLEK